uniref:Aminopeptidase n=1 Tax=Scleropages formosus TaxID=113540 RepID=A0A8C9SJF2_SCLFO
MGKGFYVSKNLGVAAVVLAAGAVATIIALSVVYAKEKSKNQEKVGHHRAIPTTHPAGAATAAPSNKPWDRYRLPDTLVPENYSLVLWPRLQPNEHGMYIFTGNSSVVFKCVKETDSILIHCHKLNLTMVDGYHAKLLSVDGSPVPTLKTTWLQEKTQLLVIQLNGNLKVGKFYQLDTQFRGELADDLEGFYRSEYYEDGAKKVIATTQMQATSARKAFPCFDEPAMKAVFSVILIHDSDMVALSNGMESATEQIVIEGHTVKKTVFQPTKRMSTYLLAFIVSDFTFVSTEQKKNNVRIWARKKATDEGQSKYALNVTGPILEFFEKYYNVSYPLPKSDQIALPDFNAGAMENWGLITYRETSLLYDPKMSSNGNKERVASVIAHELAHMWFGNLVTMRWWNDLWLNEGFATYVSYLGVDYAEPTWNIKDFVVLSEVHRVFAVDALASSHPLSSSEAKVSKSEEISEVFNSISYSKGAAVLRMLSNFLSEPVFAKGLNVSLDRTILERKSNALKLTNKGHMYSFLVVTIDTRTGQLSQKHFLLNPESVVDTPSQFNYEWYVPINWMKTGVEKKRYWLLTTHSAMKTSGTEWVLANINVSGYYRVDYDLNNWEKLLTQLNENHKDIPVINRAQILDDAFSLARIQKITLALRTTKYLSHEREYMPWAAAIRNLNYFFLMFDRSEVYGPMEAYIRKQVAPVFAYLKTITLNWSRVPAGHTDQYNQASIIMLACNNGLKECQNLTTCWFREWMQNPDKNPIHPNLKSAVYCSAIAAGGSEEWDFAWQMFKRASIASEADKLRAALACTKVPWLLNRYLQYTLDPTKIRKQDATSTIVYVASNVVGQILAWNFVRTRWEYIYSQFGGASFSFPYLIQGVTKRFSTEFDLRELLQFKDNSKAGFGSGTMALEQAIEKTKANIQWVAKNKEEVLKWFTSESA